jgi:hypothetical protein
LRFGFLHYCIYHFTLFRTRLIGARPDEKSALTNRLIPIYWLVFMMIV